MSSDWESFIQHAAQGEQDDPHVRLLREKIAEGCTIVRANLVLRAGQSPEYLIVLACNRRLSDIRIPHSDSFTRWSLETGLRMATPDEEAERFSILAEERLSPVEDRVGRDYLSAILCEQVQTLAPPISMGKLGRRPSHPPTNDDMRWDITQRLLEILRLLARDLANALRYTPTEVASLLDRALAELLDRRFHVTDRKRLFGER
jgi:hypothetical protein